MFPPFLSQVRDEAKGQILNLMHGVPLLKHPPQVRTMSVNLVVKKHQWLWRWWFPAKQLQIPTLNHQAFAISFSIARRAPWDIPNSTRLCRFLYVSIVIFLSFVIVLFGLGLSPAISKHYFQVLHSEMTRAGAQGDHMSCSVLNPVPLYARQASSLQYYCSSPFSLFFPTFSSISF